MVDFEWARGAARSVAGADAVAVTPLKGMAGGSSFDLLVAGERFVVKVEDAVAVHAEAWSCRTAGAAGVPAPIVVDVGDHGGTNFVMLRWIDGEPMDRPGHPVAGAGRALRRLHEVEGRGYGWLYEGEATDDGPTAPFDSWLEAVIAMGDTARLEEVGLLPRATGERVRTAIERHHQVLESVDTPRFLHGDLHLRHLLVRADELVGVIDWGDAAFGDPVFDFGRFRRCGRRALSQLSSGYGLEPHVSESDLVELYCCLWSINAMNLELGAGGDWFQQHVEAIERALGSLSA